MRSISAFREVDFTKPDFLQQNTFGEGMGYVLVVLLILQLGIYAFLEMIRMLREAPGTNFRHADLTGANFTGAILQNADFSDSILDYINWTQAQFYYCKFPESFADDDIQELCIYRHGQKLDFCYADFRRLYLHAVDLRDANLTKANLSEADLSHSNLENVDLSNTQALGTNFTESILTGACIYNWGINSETVFANVQCDYVYLEPGQKERKPASGNFEPGDFEKLVHHFTGTLDFLLRNGVNSQAFYSALQNLLAEYRDSSGLSMHSVIDLGDGNKLIQLNTNPDADKGSIHKVLQYLQRKFIEVKEQKRNA